MNTVPMNTEQSEASSVGHLGQSACELLFYSGVEAQARGRLAEAVEYYRRALKISLDWPEALYNLAVVQHLLADFNAARISLERLVVLRPDWPAAWLNLGSAHAALENGDAALRCWQRVLALAPADVQALYNCGTALQAKDQYIAALLFYCRALRQDPDYAPAHNNLAICLAHQKLTAMASAHLRRALLIDPDRHSSWSKLAEIETSLLRFDRALECYQKALEQQPDNAAIHYNLSVALKQNRRLEEALHHCRTALTLAPESDKALVFLLDLAQTTCDWQLVEELTPRIDELTATQIQKGQRPAESALISLRRHTDPKKNLEVARGHSMDLARAVGNRARSLKQPDALTGRRLRIGYISFDFRSHVMGHHVMGLIDAHDRKTFELFGYACNPEDGSFYRHRFARTFEHFVDLHETGDELAAKRIRGDKIDLLVDLMGHTTGSRLGILARRPAALQVNYLGFPGSNGAAWTDYLIADETVVPPEHAIFYSERIAYLPDCFLVNDQRLPIAAQPSSRQEVDLPENAVVFCCFNQMYKIDRRLFASWMRILDAVPDAVLWLLNDNAPAVANLRKAAAAAGVDPKRLRFGGGIRLDKHLARLRLADIALDTLTYNGGATTANALWAGLPVVTMLGSNFVSRMSASELRAVALSELVATTRADYEAIAIELARNAQRRNAMRRHLEENRLRLPLFDTRAFTRNIEAAYRSMIARQRQGLPPATFRVASSSPQKSLRPTTVSD